MTDIATNIKQYQDTADALRGRIKEIEEHLSELGDSSLLLARRDLLSNELFEVEAAIGYLTIYLHCLAGS